MLLRYQRKDITVKTSQETVWKRDIKFKYWALTRGKLCYANHVYFLVKEWKNNERNNASLEK